MRQSNQAIYTPIFDTSWPFYDPVCGVFGRGWVEQTDGYLCPCCGSHSGIKLRDTIDRILRSGFDVASISDVIQLAAERIHLLLDTWSNA